MKRLILLFLWVTFFATVIVPPSAAGSPVNGPDWSIAGVADFNGDSVPEVLWTNQTSGRSVVWYMDGINVLAEEQVENPSGPMWRIAGVGDFDGDGISEILWRDPATGRILILSLTGSTVAVLDRAVMPRSHWIIAGVGDFNGGMVALIFSGEIRLPERWSRGS